MCDSREFCRSSRDSTIGINFDALGDVEHFEHVSGDLFDLFKSGENSDVVFVINGTRFEAHRIILAARCNYFKVLLFGEMREAHSGAEIPIIDTTPDAFHALLEYIYSGRICLADVKEEVTATCSCIHITSMHIYVHAMHVIFNATCSFNRLFSIYLVWPISMTLLLSKAPSWLSFMPH